MSDQNQYQQAAKAAHPAHYRENAFTPEEWRVLFALRDSYRQDHDLLSARERARLRFVRWLVQTGVIEP
jgi:hypothetical protein